MASERIKIVVSVTSPDSVTKMKGFSSFLTTSLLLLLLPFTLVQGDITDGNAEHLKREHSLMKPFQGKLAG